MRRTGSQRRVISTAINRAALATVRYAGGTSGIDHRRRWLTELSSTTDEYAPRSAPVPINMAARSSAFQDGYLFLGRGAALAPARSLPATLWTFFGVFGSRNSFAACDASFLLVVMPSASARTYVRTVLARKSFGNGHPSTTAFTPRSAGNGAGNAVAETRVSTGASELPWETSHAG
jgi:hypothetical protein